MGEQHGRSPRERPSLKPEAVSRAVGATGEAAAEEIAEEAGRYSAFTVKTVETEGPPFAVVRMATWGFLEEVGVAVAAVVEVDILQKARSRAGGTGKSRCGHGSPRG